jgi:hypothetical protein
MSANPSPLPPTPADSQALDYATLRQEGIRQLERLAGSQWTDFNEHDPGITILEQLCYALSDLAYRIGFPLPDLLSEGGADPYASLHGPERILSTRPASLMDLRKLAMDVEGVQNAWLEPWKGDPPTLFFQKQGLARTDQPADLSGTKNMVLVKNVANQDFLTVDGAKALGLKGLFRVLVEKSPAIDDGAILELLAARLHAHRCLALDFHSIEVLKTQRIWLKATIEIEPQVHPEDIYVAILEKIADYISPSPRFYSLEERLSTGKPLEEIFDGPLLQRGFLDTEELKGFERKTSLRTSDLIHAVMDVEGVRLVKYLAFLTDKGDTEDWLLNLDSDKAPALDLLFKDQIDANTTQLVLERNQLAVGVDTQGVLSRFKKQFRTASPLQPAAPSSLAPPKGRDRRVGRYFSIQHQFPANYGIGALGLPDSASAERKAQARQLKAYLMLFDQLLSNGFAQLAHAADLFGFNGDTRSTYFAGQIDDPTLGLDDLWKERELDNRQSQLQRLVENPQNPKADTDWTRRHRFLDHLLARYADPLTDHTRFQPGDRSADALQRLAKDKAEVLRHYPEISGGRGAAYDVTRVGDDDNLSGLEQRLRLKLGISLPERFYVVEHILLRPIDGDGMQTAPLLADAYFDDPYSLQLSLVLAGDSSARFKYAGFRQFAEQTIREETPAHLIVRILWPDGKALAEFEQAYAAWLDVQRNYRLGSKQGVLYPSGDRPLASVHRYRYARDRVADSLGLGRTYPLADLDIGKTVTVPYGTPAEIPIADSQPGVVYTLCDKVAKPVLAGPNGIKTPITVTGNGATVNLRTLPIVEDQSFTILATKLHGVEGNGKELSLIMLNVAAVKVGLDEKLRVRFLNEESLALLVDYGAAVQVQIEQSQEGVDYRLVDLATWQSLQNRQIDASYIQAADSAMLSTSAVRGKLDSIILSIGQAKEDMDVYVLAIKIFDSSENRPNQAALLDTILSLKVRANPALGAAAVSAIVDYQGSAGIIIQTPQASARYQAFVRPIADDEFIRVGAIGNALQVDVPGKDAVRIRNPGGSLRWNPPSRFLALGTPLQGQPGQTSLTLDLGHLAGDSLLIIQAHKDHPATTDGTTIVGHTVTPAYSEIQLVQAVAVLVRPNPAPALRLRAAVANGLLQSPIQVLGGEPGVFYHFTRLAGGDLGQPVYFHQQDSRDLSKNKGIRGDKAGDADIALEIGVDFVVTASLPPAKPASSDYPPVLPELDAGGLETNAELSIVAVKAQTGVETETSFQRKAGDLLEQPAPPPQ